MTHYFIKARRLIAVSTPLLLAITPTSADAQVPVPIPVTPTIKAKIEQIVEGKVPLTVDPKPPAGVYVGEKCTVKVIAAGDERFLTKDGSCAPIWGAPVASKEDITLTAQGGALAFKFRVDLQVDSAKVAGVQDGQRITIPCTPAGLKVYESVAGGAWSSVAVEPSCSFESKEKASYLALQGAAVSVLTVEAPKVTAPGNAEIPPGPYDDDKASLDECWSNKMKDEARVICLRVDRFLQPHLVYLPPRYRDHILPPNTSLDVLIVHPPGVTVDVALSGEIALSTAATDDFRLDDNKPKAVVTGTYFGPRRPDSAAILTVTASQGATKGKPWSLEMFVEKTYSGALRLGIGVLFGRAVDHDYSAVKVDNSNQHEIVAKTGGRAEFELVVGYTPFIFDMMAGKKGRAYQSTTLRQRAAGFAPYVGLGALTVGQATGIEFFRSIHLGMEWEPLRNFSIAATFVMRRVTRLQHGYEVGSPVANSDPPTREQLALGFGLVLNLTPEFFRFATRGSSSLLRGTSSGN